MDSTFNVPTVYFIDSASIERIKRLVKSMMRAEANNQKHSAPGKSQRGGAFTRARKRLTDKPYQAPTSIPNPLWDDPVRQRLRLVGQGTGAMALERLNALIKILADHLNRNVPLPRGWTRHMVNRMINQILTRYKKEIELSAFPMNKSMTRAEAMAVLTGVKGLPDNFTAVLDGQQAARQQRTHNQNLLLASQGNLVHGQSELLENQYMNDINLNDAFENLDAQYAKLVDLLSKQSGPRTRSKTKAK